MKGLSLASSPMYVHSSRAREFSYANEAQTLNPLSAYTNRRAAYLPGTELTPKASLLKRADKGW